MISGEKLVKFAYAWSEVFYRYVDCENMLLHSGCQVFKVYQDYLAQFAENSRDIDVHKIIYCETSRRRAINSCISANTAARAVGKLYSPQILETMRLTLAQEAGFADVEAWIQSKNPSSTELDPDPLYRSMRKIINIEVYKHDRLEHFREEMRSKSEAALQGEARNFRDSNFQSFSGLDRLNAFKEVCLEYLSPLGFQLLPTSAKNYVALELRVDHDIFIIWSVGKDNPFFFFRTYPPLCRPSLHIEFRAPKNTVRQGQNQSVRVGIPFASIVEGLSETYQVCHNFQEMVAIVFAHTLVVTWLLPRLLEAARFSLF